MYDVPTEIDDEIARLKLATMGVAIDELTEEQATYLASLGRGHVSRSSPNGLRARPEGRARRSGSSDGSPR